MENVKFHVHNGVDAPQVSGSDLLGFRVATTIPTDIAPEGTVTLYSDGATTFALYVRINNSWKKTLLT